MMGDRVADAIVQHKQKISWQLREIGSSNSADSQEFVSAKSVASLRVVPSYKQIKDVTDDKK